MIFAEYAHYLGMLIMSLNIQLSSHHFNILDKILQSIIYPILT